MSLRFQLRLNDSSLPLDLDPFLVKGGYSRSVTIAAEDQLNNFRGSQIQVTLDDRLGTFSTGSWALSGGEEIAIVDLRPGQTITWWSGTVDPLMIKRETDSTNLIIRALQHGSLLNTIDAGLPDWTLVDGEIVLNGDSYDRYKGKADNWVRLRNSDGTFGHNQIAEEEADVFYTPTAKEALTDDLYKAKFATRVKHFHTAASDVGGVEWPMANTIQQGVENAATTWTGPFQQHYHPDFETDPSTWENTDGAVIPDYGAYLRNPNQIIPFRRQAVQSILSNLIEQYNRTARFPISFNPDTDCILQPPVIQQQIEILKRQSGVDFIDIQHFPSTITSVERTLLLVNWKNLDDGDSTLRFSIYEISNETELNIIADRVEIEGIGGVQPHSTWPTFGGGMRFARAKTIVDGNNTAFFYTMRWSAFVIPGTRNQWAARFDVFSCNVALSNLNMNGPFHVFINEELGEYNDFPGQQIVVNRSAQIATTGTATVRDANPPYDPWPPELEPQQSTTVNDRHYTARQGGLTVSGALFDRVGVDAENTKLSAIISDLAKLTHSKWWVTPDRTLKFVSRLHPGNTVSLKPSRILTAPHTFSREYTEEDIPTIGSELVLPENFKQAHVNWIRDHVISQKSPGFVVEVPLEDIPAPPTFGDRIDCPDPDIPQIADPTLRQKYGQHLFEQAELDVDNETLTITAAIPTL